MSVVQTEKFQITCRKCTNIVILDKDPGELFKCPVCDPSNFKSSIHKIYRCNNHPHYAWKGDPDCNRCIAEKLQKKLERQKDPIIIDVKHHSKLKEDEAGVTMALDNVRRNQLREEQKVKQATLETPRLLSELIQEVKKLREDLKK